MTITENLDAYLQDFGVAVTWGSVSGLGILDSPDTLIAGGAVISAQYSLLCKTADFGGINYGDTITVDGVNYQAQNVMRVDDGKLCRIDLTRPSS